jgi:hypothetical protein
VIIKSGCRYKTCGKYRPQCGAFFHAGELANSLKVQYFGSSNVPSPK